MWSRITSPRPRSRAGGGTGGSGGGAGVYRRNSSTSSVCGSRTGSVKGRDYDHRGSLIHGSSPLTGSRSASIRDHRRRRASRGYVEGEDDLEWGDDGGGGGGGSEWEDTAAAREAIKAAAAASRIGTRVTYEDEDDDDEDAEEENDEVIASLDSLTSSHQSSIGGDVRANRTTLLGTGTGGEGPPPPAYTESVPLPAQQTTTNNTATANTSFPRLIPSRYRIRDFLLGDFSFNDDGERYVDPIYIHHVMLR